MFTVVSTFDCSPVITEYNLIIHWLNHFLSLGAKKFYFGLRYQSHYDLSLMLDTIDSILGNGKFLLQYQAVERPYVCEENEVLKNQIIDKIDIDWVAISDIDEFPKYPKRINDIILDCIDSEKIGINGILVDRISEPKISLDSILPAISLDSPLSNQFPYRAELVKNVMQGRDEKVVLFCKHKGKIETGHHWLNDFEGKRLSDDNFLCRLDVDHYKWSKSLRLRTTNRVKNALRNGLNWSRINNRNLISHMQWNRRV